MKRSAYGIGGDVAQPPATHTVIEAAAVSVRPLPLASSASSLGASASSVPATPVPNGGIVGGAGGPQAFLPVAAAADADGAVKTEGVGPILPPAPISASESPAVMLASEASAQVAALQRDLEEVSLAAEARLRELNDLYAQHTATKQELEKLRCQVGAVASQHSCLTFVSDWCRYCVSAACVGSLSSQLAGVFGAVGAVETGEASSC